MNQEKIFQKRKSDILKKQDKSNINKWDFRIAKLCKKINKLKDYYTTSSCSGRIVLIKSSEKKQPELFLFRTHELITFKQLKNEVEKIKKTKIKNLIYFKQESCILHIVCSSLEKAQHLFNKGKLAGWKKSGIIATQNRFIVELASTEKIEMPLLNKRKLLVDENYLKLLIDEANNKLKRSWEKIERLEKMI